MRPPVRLRRKASRDRLGFLLLAVAVAIGGTLLGFAAYLSNKRPKLDKSTMCPQDGPKGLVAVLIDVTDPLSEVQSADLKNQLAKMKEAIPEYCAIDIYTVSSSPGLLKSLGERVCNPGDG